MTESQIKSVALFFYYAFLDERLALHASIAALRKIRKRLKKSDVDSDDTNKIIIFFCHQAWRKFKGRKPLFWPGVHAEAGWQVPKSLDLGPWREFINETDDEVVIAVILSKLLSFKDFDVAKGLGVTIGTHRYRVGNGIRTLGIMAQPGVTPL